MIDEVKLNNNQASFQSGKHVDQTTSMDFGLKDTGKVGLWTFRKRKTVAR